MPHKHKLEAVPLRHTVQSDSSRSGQSEKVCSGRARAHWVTRGEERRLVHAKELTLGGGPPTSRQPLRTRARSALKAAARCTCGLLWATTLEHPGCDRGRRGSQIQPQRPPAASKAEGAKLQQPPQPPGHWQRQGCARCRPLAFFASKNATEQNGRRQGGAVRPNCEGKGSQAPGSAGTRASRAFEQPRNSAAATISHPSLRNAYTRSKRTKGRPMSPRLCGAAKALAGRVPQAPQPQGIPCCMAAHAKPTLTQ
jgi:hypothetical protein